MIKRFFPVIFVLAACGASDNTPFCNCMKAGNELNEYAAEVLEAEVIDASVQKKMDALKTKQKKACKAYETMGGDKMLELKRACTETNEEMPN